MNQIEPLTEVVNGAGKNDPIAKLLMSVPGIGAMLVSAWKEIGVGHCIKDLATFCAIRGALPPARLLMMIFGLIP